MKLENTPIEQVELLEFSPINTDNIECSDEAYSELARAEKAYNHYQEMIKHTEALDKIIKPIGLEDPEWDLMTEEDEIEILEHCSMDVIDYLNKHIKTQIKRFKQYCEDLEALAIDLKGQEEELRKYGSAEDQARSWYYSER